MAFPRFQFMIFLFFYASVSYGRTVGQTDGPKDGLTDRPSYGDARTQLEKLQEKFLEKLGTGRERSRTGGRISSRSGRSEVKARVV